MTVREPVMRRLSEAFLDHGYDQLTMSGLAKLCGLTRRGLYHHFSNKEEAFRATIRAGNDRTRAESLAAGRQLLADGAGVLDILAGLLDVRYGNTRRRLSQSPHAQELNDQAFRSCRDIMVEAATQFQSDFAAFMMELVAHGHLALRPGYAVEELVQLLSDGARGINQTLPTLSPNQIAYRYRRMSEAILYGFAAPTHDAPADQAQSIRMASALSA
ncbi:MAG: helix-turn-helix domain containing protein [Azospirillaceae bacterium]|nr:helix-turn-helix domain containing protein [Azospirillaceae bacterium]